jgi:protein TonB
MHKARIRRSRRRPATLETPREERSLPERSGSLPRYFDGETSRRDLKVAALCALGLHFALFFVVLPSAEVTPIRVDERRSATVLQRWEPPASSPRPERPRNAKKTPVPIPDPTPRDPEPIFDATTDTVGLGEADAEFSVGLPGAPPGKTGARARAVGAGSAGLLAPQLLQKVVPEYSPSATRSGIQGRVYIEAVITETGAVIEPELISGLPDDDLNQRALAAVQRWKFKPGMKEGQPVMVVATFVIDFNIH